VTYRLTVLDAGGGTATPKGSGSYLAGTPVEVRAAPAPGWIFAGWTVDGVAGGWANPLVVTMDGHHTVAPAFALAPAFADLAPTDPAHPAITQLAARGIVRGYDPTTFGPGDVVLRAQMAALIARAMGWDAEDWGTPFTDRGGVDDDLWRNVGTLAHYGVARGYGDGTYAPLNPVLHAQVISFVTRAMVAEGYWTPRPADPALYGGVLNGTGHEEDVATYLHYTRARGGVPDYPEGGPFAAWDGPASRAWFARALWAALDSYWGAVPAP
jgi:hypothetical protein